jgi:hypothetical protein
MNTFNTENDLRSLQQGLLRLLPCEMYNHAVWQLETKKGICYLKVEAHIPLLSSVYQNTKCHISEGCHFNYNLTCSNNGSHSSWFLGLSNTTLRNVRMSFGSWLKRLCQWSLPNIKNLPVTEEHYKILSGQPVSCLTFEPKTSQSKRILSATLHFIHFKLNIKLSTFSAFLISPASLIHTRRETKLVRQIIGLFPY